MKCPKCKAEIKLPGQSQGGKSRWKGFTAKQRSEAMRRVRRGEKSIKQKQPIPTL